MGEDICNTCERSDCSFLICDECRNEVEKKAALSAIDIIDSALHRIYSSETQTTITYEKSKLSAMISALKQHPPARGCERCGKRW